ncbi:MAG: ATP-dependent Clp protease proteolytic subunit [Bacilli bacterium]|nr:ATP-dependent Clp protease proteolytic subunit [Bacilli bacterium]
MDLVKDFRKFAIDKKVPMTVLDDVVKNTNKTAYISPYVIEEREMHATTLDLFSRFLLDRILFLNSEVNSDVASILSAQLLWLNQQSDSDITMHISSPGGCIYSGLEIIDTMNFINPKITTVSMGMVASMASVIASCGEKGKRFILPHARFLIHQPLSSMPYSQASDITIHTNEINSLKKELYTILSDNSKLSYEEVEAKCDRDCILTAQEAVDFGFVDEIIKKN